MTTDQQPAACYIYGCDKPRYRQVRNRGTGVEMDLCEFHTDNYLMYPTIEELTEPDDPRRNT